MEFILAIAFFLLVFTILISAGVVIYFLSEGIILIAGTLIMITGIFMALFYIIKNAYIIIQKIIKESRGK